MSTYDFEEIYEKGIKINYELGKIEERNRILTALAEKDLSLNVWSEIKDIINPKE